MRRPTIGLPLPRRRLGRTDLHRAWAVGVLIALVVAVPLIPVVPLGYPPAGASAPGLGGRGLGVIPGSGVGVTVSPGQTWITNAIGRVIRASLKRVVHVRLAAPPRRHPRIDTIVAVLGRGSEPLGIGRSTGNPTAGAGAPAFAGRPRIPRSSLPVAFVRVRPGAKFVQRADITPIRPMRLTVKPLSGLTLEVDRGRALVPTSSGQLVASRLARPFRLPLAPANPLRPRIDIVAVALGAGNSARIIRSTGNASFGATLVNLFGRGRVPPGSLPIAFVRVPAAATTLSSNDVAGLAPTAQSAGVAPLRIGGVLLTAVRAVMLGVGLLMTIALLGVGRIFGALGRSRAIVLSLLVMAALGVAIAAAHAGTPRQLLSMLSKTAGQPLIYGALLACLVTTLQADPRNRRRLLAAWSVMTIVEAAFVVIQLVSGAAYDPLRGFTRPQGTVGADFVGALAGAGLFGGLALLAAASDRRAQVLGIAAVVGALVTLSVVQARGALVTVALAMLFLAVCAKGRLRAHVVTRWRLGSGTRGRAGVVIAAMIIAFGGLVLVSRSLWLPRLNASSTRGFDRPATWLAGLRLAADHPLIGAGPVDISRIIAANPRYRSTPFGATGINPHNTWIYAADEGGIPYAVALVVVTLLFLWALWRRRERRVEDPYLWAAMIVLGPLFAINNLFTHPEVMVVTLLTGGMLLARDPGDAPTPDEATPAAAPDEREPESQVAFPRPGSHDAVGHRSAPTRVHEPAGERGSEASAAVVPSPSPRLGAGTLPPPPSRRSALGRTWRRIGLDRRSSPPGSGRSQS